VDQKLNTYIAVSVEGQIWGEKSQLMGWRYQRSRRNI